MYRFMKTKKLVAVLFSALALLIVGCDKTGNNNGGNGSGLSDMTFEIEVSDITTSGAKVSVVPSDETALYYFDKVTKDVYATYKSDKEFMVAMVEALRTYCEESGSSLASAVSVGNDEYTYNGELIPGTEYYIFAFALDAKLNPNSELTLEPFTTEAAKSSSNTFTIEVNGGTVMVSTSNNDPYFWDVVPSETYEGKDDEYIMNDLITYYRDSGYLEYYIVQGTDAFDYTNSLSDGESYTVYVFGFEGVPTTALTKHTFTYTSGGSGSGSGSGDYDTTTLTGDVELDIASAEAYYYGDYYDIGTNNWEIGMFDATGREFVIAEFFTALSQSTPEGTYTITGNAGDAGTAYTGDVDQEGYILPTYYGKLTADGETEAMALVASGSFSIVKSDSNYTLTLNLADVLEHKITGSYTGAVKVAAGELSGSQASVGRAGRVAARSTLRRFSSVATLRPTMVEGSLKAVRAK